MQKSVDTPFLHQHCVTIFKSCFTIFSLTPFLHNNAVFQFDNNVLRPYLLEIVRRTWQIRPFSIGSTILLVNTVEMKPDGDCSGSSIL